MISKRTRHVAAMLVGRGSLLPILLALLVTGASGQTAGVTDGKTPSGLAPGAPAGSYALSGFDSVNLFNGNLNSRLPLISIGGRGSAGYTMMLPIEQKWIVKRGETSPSGFTPLTPSPNWWQGIRPGYGPGVLQGRRTSYETARAYESYGDSQILREVYLATLTRLTFTGADGTEYEFRDQLTGGQPNNCSWYPTQGDGPGFSRGTVFITADGSGATFVSDTAIVDYKAITMATNHSLIYPSGYLLFKDGTRYRIDGGGVSWIRDRNGNKVSFGTAITDSLNRTFTVTGDDGVRHYDEVSYSGFGGSARKIRVWYDSLSNRLRPGSGYSIQTYYQLFPLNSSSSYSTYDPGRVSEVELPDGRRYKFYYNPYGELARVVLPTGGAFEYDWAGGAYEADEVIFRYVTERRVYLDDGVTLENKTQYIRPDPALGGGGTVEVKMFGAANILLADSIHYFYGDPYLSIVEEPGRPSSISYSRWKEGREYRTDTFDIVNGTSVLKQKIEQTWQQPLVGSTWPLTQAETSEDAKPNDPQITQTVTTFSDTNQVAKQTFTYDKYCNRTDVYEYDYGVGASGPLLRHTHADYVTAANYTDAAGAHLRSLSNQQSVFDAAGTERARATYEYDNYATDANHANLADRSSISGLDSAFTTSYTTRGNATSTTHYLLVGGTVTSSISAYAQYDIAGNLVKTIDGRGYATTFDFSDRFGAPDGEARSNYAPLELSSLGQASYAFPTLVTNALGQTAYSQHDYYTGRPVDGEDANGIVSSAYCNDPLDRPTQIIHATNDLATKNQTTFSYDDLNHIITTTSDQSSYNDNGLKSQMIYDGLGRTIESRQYEGGTNYIAAQTQYDAMGRAFKTSNPFRPWNSESPIWTTGGYDALGRVVTVTTPDNAVMSTSYSGNAVTVTDQAGKQRQSVTDGLGRLIQVYEDPAGLNYLTSYSYDALDNLTTVTQGSQTRSFVYDSLKRLISATNPESGAISYQYDANGNLTQKIDARSITTNYAYDALNRATSRSYSDGTPAVTYVYDAPGVANSKGRLTSVSSSVFSYSYGGYDALGKVLSGSQTIGAHTYSISYAYDVAGHLKIEIYPSGHVVNYAFDAAGRLNNFNGYLGDGTLRTYSAGISYASAGQMMQEQFGTTTPVYNKLSYNSRGQLINMLASTSGNDTTFNRGKIVNDYSGTDNNGNLRKQTVFIPNSDQNTSPSSWYQQYDYDSLNRLQAVHEYTGNTSIDWQQAYTYDRYGNRTIDYNNTSSNIPRAQFTVSTSTNRLGVPSGQSGTMSYDNAGNLTTDTYSAAAVTRAYDAENRMTSETQGNNYIAGSYTYDGDGRRVKRNVNSTETWQVYGLGGELLAEYAHDGAASTPQKEYGYRNGQLLIIATAPTGLAANKPTARPGAGAADSSAASREPRATEARQSGDLLASNKSSDLAQWAGVGERTEALSDTSTPLYGPSFSYGSLRSGLFPIPLQSGPTKIAFASNREGSAQIYSMNTDGSGLSRLTNDVANDEAPNWSPNNSRIVFQSDRDNLFSGIADIYVMNWDGSGQTRLTSDAADDSAPVWSPDGTKIAFQSARNGASYQIYVMNADGSGQVNVSNSAANDTQASWSSDGSKIAFASDRDQAGFSSIYVMNANGTNQTRLTISGTGLLDQQPAWSPDGTRLTFTSTRDSIVQTWQETDDNGGIVTKSKLLVNKEVYLMNANGSAQVRLTNTLENDDSASWSGDGTKIVFRSERERDCCDPTQQVWVMNSDGSSQVNLSVNPYGDHCPSWQHLASNVPPTVSVTSPANGATLMAPANITITASASDSDGTISKVDFYQGTTLIGTDTIAPYSFNWNNVAAGSYSLTARATDNGGATSTSGAVTVTVNSAPSVSITSPTSGAIFNAPANITISANASDSDGSVSRVDFYQGNTLIGASAASPYTISWNNVAAGSYSLTARATDNLGATTTSTAVNITVNAPPTVSITSPANGATFTAPANITISANASDSDGSISRVDFYQGTTLIGTATTSPYTITWNNVVAGGYTLTARATDNLGASTNSNPVNITVGSAPTVSVTTPANGANFTAPANVTITANASSSTGSISRVEFYQGTTLIGTSTASPYTISWNNVTAGSYTLKARAVDNSGASTDSTPVNISVNAPPTVSVTTPTTGASFTAPANITVTANASDSDGTISRVDFYQGTTLVGTATATPYTISWNNVTAGSYALTAKATDNLGAQTTSTAVNITVITPVADIRWIVTDQLGTPRMSFDQTGSLANVSRHDYLPFGEELTAGGRTTAVGYGVGDGARQKFTQKERDNETGLDYFGARYFASTQGRFISPDPLLSSGKLGDPQTWNHYSYTLNNPLTLIDPTGLFTIGAGVSHEEQEQIIAAYDTLVAALGKLKAGSKAYKSIERSLNRLGKPGQANGIVVTIGKPADSGAAGETDVNKIDKGSVTITFSRKEFAKQSAQDRAASLGHEGVHADDAFNLFAISNSMADFRSKWNSNDNQYQTEYNAFFAMGGVYQTVGLNNRVYGFGSYTRPTPPGMAQYLPEHLDLWNPSWRELDQKQIESKQGSIIRTIIEGPKGSGPAELYGRTRPKNFQP